MADLTIYISILIVLLLVAFVSDSIKNKEVKALFFLLFCVFYSFVFGARTGFGHDFANYLSNYIQIGQNTYYNQDLIVFHFLNEIFSVNHFSYNTYLTFITFIMCILSFYRSYERSMLTASLFTFVIFGTLFFYNNGLKQAFAMSFFLFSLNYITERNIYKFLCITLVAAFGFHYSALILLLIYFIPDRTLDKSTALTLMFICFIGAKLEIFSDLYLQYIHLIPFYGEIYISRIESEVQSLGTGLTFILQIVMIYGLFVFKDVVNNDRLLNMVLIGICGTLIFIRSDVILRIFYYFSYLPFLGYAIILKQHMTLASKRKILLFALLSIQFLYFCFEVYSGTNKNKSGPFQLFYIF
jgi:hypothetical protein